MDREWNPFAIVRRAPRLGSERQVARLSLVAASSIGVVIFVGAVYGQAKLASNSSPGFVGVVVATWALWVGFTVYWGVSAWRFARLSGGYFAYEGDWQARAAGFDPRIAAAERARRQENALPGDLQSSVHGSPRFATSGSLDGESSGGRGPSSWRDAEARAARWLSRIDDGAVQGRVTGTGESTLSPFAMWFRSRTGAARWVHPQSERSQGSRAPEISARSWYLAAGSQLRRPDSLVTRVSRSFRTPTAGSGRSTRSPRTCRGLGVGLAASERESSQEVSGTATGHQAPGRPLPQSHHKWVASIWSSSRSSPSSNRSAYRSSVIAADAWPSILCTDFTLPPAFTAMDAAVCRRS